MPTRAPEPLAVQVLFEPWPAEAGADREGYEAFAGRYFIDALDESGAFVDRGFRAVVAGCTTCRRSDADERAHWMQAVDLAPDKPKRRCPQWKKVEAIVKAFGGWARVHYVELAEHEGLAYQSIPQRHREIMKCPACDGTGLGPMDMDALSEWYETRTREAERRIHPPCAARCGSYGYRSKGEVLVKYEGPVRPDRFAMSEAQRRMR